MTIYTDYNSINTLKTDAAAINNAIKNIILTPIGSMPGKPTFGSNINKILFSQLDDISESNLRIYITEALAIWEPRIIIKNIKTKRMSEFNKLIVTVEYAYRDKGLLLNDRVNINLTN